MVGAAVFRAEAEPLRQPAVLTRTGCNRRADDGQRCRGLSRGLSAAPFIPAPAISFHAIAGIGVYEYVALKDYIAGLFGGRVDVVSRDDRRPILS